MIYALANFFFNIFSFLCNWIDARRILFNDDLCMSMPLRHCRLFFSYWSSLALLTCTYIIVINLLVLVSWLVCFLWYPLKDSSANAYHIRSSFERSQHTSNNIRFLSYLMFVSIRKINRQTGRHSTCEQTTRELIRSSLILNRLCSTIVYCD